MKKPKAKKTSTSRNPKGSGRKPGVLIPGIQKHFFREYPGQDPRAEFHPERKPDPERTLPEPTDEASKHQFPPPRKNPTFRRVWMQFIDNVSKRDNFKIGHLNALEILCDLYTEHETIQEFVRTNGRSYLCVGRNGDVWKFYPEVNHLKSVQHQIAVYMKQLDLILKKDQSTESGGEKENWE